MITSLTLLSVLALTITKELCVMFALQSAEAIYRSNINSGVVIVCERVDSITANTDKQSNSVVLGCSVVRLLSDGVFRICFDLKK